MDGRVDKRIVSIITYKVENYPWLQKENVLVLRKPLNLHKVFKYIDF